MRWCTCNWGTCEQLTLQWSPFEGMYPAGRKLRNWEPASRMGQKRGKVWSSGRWKRTVQYTRGFLLSCRRRLLFVALMGKCSRSIHPRKYRGNSRFLCSPSIPFSFLSPLLPLWIWTWLPRLHILVHTSSFPLPFSTYELEAPFPNHPVGKKWLLATFTLKFEYEEEKERGKSS